MHDNATRIHPDDNVAVALVPLARGDSVRVDDNSVVVSSDIDSGHKVALAPIRVGDPIVKFGQPIGIATTEIAAGDLVHKHNTGTRLSGHVQYQYTQSTDSVVNPNQSDHRFMGYKRADGSVGTRNEIWILVTVGCVNRLAQRLASAYAGANIIGIDGVHAFPHPFGCSQSSSDKGRTRDLIAALCQHPNAGGVLLLGLGCETNQASDVLSVLTKNRRQRVRYLETQQVEDEFEAGKALIDELIESAATDKRESCGMDAMAIGVKCGGSDGFSGISANPLVGSVADVVTDAGGSVYLTEVPEMFGAEHLLLNRAVSKAVFQDTVSLIANFKDHFLSHGEQISDNPSPGNVAGGITTLEEKSLGAIQKGGRGAVSKVVNYAEPCHAGGLILVEGPGNDAVSSTALIAAGATIVLFTTGRGTPLAPPVPTLKISSTSALAQRKPNWIDFDGGRYLDGTNKRAVRNALVAQLLTVASGNCQTTSEKNDQREIAIWKTGVTL